MAHTLDTGGRIDLVDGLTFRDGLRGTFRLAGTTGDALVRDLHCHGPCLQVRKGCLVRV